MPEYACEPGEFDVVSVYPYTPSAGKYANDEFQYVYNNHYEPDPNYAGSMRQVESTRICGFLAEASTISETEEKPLNFYLAVVALVYCVVLTIVFAVWASRHPRNIAVMRRAPTRPLPSPPQVVIQNQV